MAPFVRTARLGNGLDLPYVEHGDQSGIPVVLVHAYADSWRFFEPLFPFLPSSIHAWAMTQRGHGDADKPASGYRLVDFSDDLAAFMDAVHLDRAVVVGHSSGGYVARQLVADHPGRVSALMLIGSPGSLHHRRAPFADAVDRLRDPVSPTFVDRFFDFFPLTARVPTETVAAQKQDALKMPARVWRAALEGLTNADPPDPAAITVPTLVVSGESDDLLARAEQEALAAAIPGSRFQPYADAGHLVLWDQPARIAADLVTLAERAAP